MRSPKRWCRCYSRSWNFCTKFDLKHLWLFCFVIVCFISCLLPIRCIFGYDTSPRMDDFYDLNNWRRIQKRLMDRWRSEIMICRMDLHQSEWPSNANNTVARLYNEWNWPTKLIICHKTSLFATLCQRCFPIGDLVS